MSNLNKATAARASLLTPQPGIKAQVQVTLTSDQYKRLEAAFPVRITSDPVTASIYLGQQMVLAELRKGFVTE